MRAADRFDPDKGFRFSTYATWWIRQRVERGIRDRSRAIRLPVHLGDKLARTHDVSSAMAAKLGRDPTPEELANELGWKMEKVLDVLSAPPEPSSLERPVGSADQDDRAQVGDFLADASPDSSPAERAVEALDANQLRRTIDGALARLKPAERTAIVRRYGLDGEDPRKLEDIASELGLSRERVRQLQRRAEEYLARALRDHAA